MAFVKLDVDILESTLWAMPVERDVFITALLKAKPKTIHEPMAQLDVETGDPTGWTVPPGEYGFIEAAGVGILRRAFPSDPEGAGRRRKVTRAEGMQALRTLGQPEADSRSPEHDGRRLVRVAGGFIALNFKKYRDKDHTNADRQHRFRERQKAEHQGSNESNGVTSLPVTQADAEADLRKDRRSAKRAFPADADLEGWKKRGEELGVQTIPGESWNDFKARVRKMAHGKGRA